MIGKTMATMAVAPFALLLQASQDSSGGLTPDQQFEIAKEAMKHGPNSAVEVVVPIAFFAMIILIVWLATRRRQAQIRAQAEVRKQLIEKFGSGQELAAFLESSGGRQFFGDMQARAANRLRFLPGGVITTMLGLAFLGLTVMRRNFIIPGVLALAVGIGMLISAAIAHKLAPKTSGQETDPGSGMQQAPRA
jgi:heme/copper-type cytochrome/quinol oxidase subunit 3